MVRVDRDALKPLARKYVWWKTPDEALSMPERVIAQVMTLATTTTFRRSSRTLATMRSARSWFVPRRVSSTNARGLTGTTDSA